MALQNVCSTILIWCAHFDRFLHRVSVVYITGEELLLTDVLPGPTLFSILYERTAQQTLLRYMSPFIA
jgi:hypothetical protein